jgi:hypothetical protein
MKRLFFALGFGVFALALQSLFRSGIRRRHVGKQVKSVSYDDIALRAYFIGLDREARGEPSSPLRDWEEAERQLSVQTQCAAPAWASALTRW